MSKWQPIETAPANTKVLCGRWYYYASEKKWEQSDAFVWETYLFGLIRKKAHGADFYSHWRPLDEPPEDQE